MPTPKPKPDPGPLILASGSRYRTELLQRLGIAFEQQPSDCDETPAPGEAPAILAARLAEAKARKLTERRPGRWVLGSDQVCVCAGEILGKPGSRTGAEFFTAVALLRDSTPASTALDVTRVQLRALTDAEIERYLDAEPAFDCAGSFKSEGLGIALCASIESSDPTALIGLPLIATARLLRDAGYHLP